MKMTNFLKCAALVTAAVAGKASVNYAELRREERQLLEVSAEQVDAKTHALSENALAHDGMVVEKQLNPSAHGGVPDTVTISKPYAIALFELKANAAQALETRQKNLYTLENILRL